MDVKTVSEAFIEFLQNKGIATFGTDLFLNQVPSSLATQDSLYWIITSGGGPIQTLRTGEKVKQYYISVYYRSRSNKDVEHKLFELEELLNCTECVQLTGFDVIYISAEQFPSDTDLDDEERRVGFLQATIRVYKTC
jgi:hypothetical protein